MKFVLNAGYGSKLSLEKLLKNKDLKGIERYKYENLDQTIIKTTTGNKIFGLGTSKKLLEKYVGVIYNDYLYVNNENAGCIDRYELIDVDTSKKWYIEEYDGAESVVYLDDYECENEELNFYSIK